MNYCIAPLRAIFADITYILQKKRIPKEIIFLSKNISVTRVFLEPFFLDFNISFVLSDNESQAHNISINSVQSRVSRLYQHILSYDALKALH
jgi:hypothetical protein